MLVGVFGSLVAEACEKIDAVVIERLGNRFGSGYFRRIARVLVFTASMLLIDSNPAPIGPLPLPLIKRSSETAAASALNAVPSWNFTPWRSWRVSVRPSFDVSHEVASIGLILPCV